jgi:protein-S-isoprenylcysteine O-methyltransferase Ste14
MINASFLGLVALYLAALAVRTIYELLKKAGRVDPRNQALFVVILLDMIVMWASWFTACAMDPARLVLPAIVHRAGLSALAVGLALAVGALIQLRGVENIDHLVTTGFFGGVRHPMYVGFVLWILGWAVYQGAVVGLAVGLVGIANILFWRRLEERHLEARYGDAYRAYRARTWF